MVTVQRSLALGVLAACCLSSGAAAQSINIDFGQPLAGPASTYAGAGRPGVWNSIPAFDDTFTNNLLGLDGAPTPVRLYQYGGTQTLLGSDPDTQGDDDALMDDYLVTFDPALESCLFIRFLEIARYEIIVYARMPDQPTVLSYTSCDEEPGFPHHSIGGAWPGAHVEGVTFGRHFGVPDDALQRLRIHSGIVPAAPAALGAALNGVQLIKIDPGDANGDQSVNVADLLMVITAWGACADGAGTCAADIAPYPHGDGVVNVVDLLATIMNWG